MNDLSKCAGWGQASSPKAQVPSDAAQGGLMRAQSLILIYDDLDLHLGRIRIRRKGSAGGHHGIESVLNILGTQEILRVRLGIGEEQMPDDRIGFVLSDFPPEIKTELDGMIIKAGDAVKSILSNGVSKSMTIFNA